MDKNALKVTVPAPRDAWREIIKQDPYALVSHTPEWIDSICKSGPYIDATVLVELSHSRVALLPAVRLKSLYNPLNSEKSLPHGWGLGGLVAPGGVTPEIITQILPGLSDVMDKRISIRPNPLLASIWKLSIPSWVKSERHVTQILSLEGGFDQVWVQRFNSATRTKVRKAEKSGLIIQKDDSGNLLPEFYQLYLRWSENRARERHLPAVLSRWMAHIREPYSKFKAVTDNLGPACHLWVARLEDQLVAAAFLLLWGDHAIYWRSASDKELTLQTRANDLLQKKMIEDACQSGCRYYHMGESGGVASLMHFKSRFGGIEYPYEEYFFGNLPFDGFSEKMKSLYQRTEHTLFTQNRK